MNTTTSVLAASLLAVAAFANRGQEQKATPEARKPTKGEQLFTGSSVDGNLQAALDKALQTAQQSLAKSTQIADLRFEYEVDTITGRRGGLMGSQDVNVTIRITGGTPATR